jgi:predicted site-specific integrase-resolvase
MMRALLHRLFGCRHRQMHRERRTRFGCGVLHYVCDDCGHAVPIVQRTEAETVALFLDQVH